MKENDIKNIPIIKPNYRPDMEGNSDGEPQGSAVKGMIYGAAVATFVCLLAIGGCIYVAIEKAVS